MKKKLSFKLSLKNLSVFRRAFLILAIVFFVIGFGTLGSVQSLGKSYRLPKQRSGDGMAPAIMLHLEEPGQDEKDFEHRDLYIKQIYVNVGTAYTDYGKDVTLQVSYGVSTSSKFYSHVDYSVANVYREVKQEGSDVFTKENENMLFNWGTVDLNSTSGYRLATYPYWRLTAVNGDILVNEIVFVANDLENEGEDVVLNATINTELTNLPEPDSEVVKKATSVIDRQKVPSLAQSSYFSFMPEEVAVLSTYSEVRLGSAYGTGNVNHMDRIYSPFGLDILFLGPAIFGFSPFGLRVVPMLASFGVLIFSYLFVKKLTNSEKAAFFFSLLYALCGMSISLAHLGTPLMIGVFFFVAALYFCFGFYCNGMKDANFRSAAPVIATALLAVAAVCTNGAFLIPVLFLIGLFAAGVIRQRKALYATISEEAEKALQEEESASEEDPTLLTGKKKVAKLVTEANYRRTVSVSLFATFFVLGFFLLSILAILPLYSTFVKVLDDPANPQKSIFYFLFAAFGGGFAGSNGIAEIPSSFHFFYVLYRGTGNFYAVTAGGTILALAGILLGVCGAVVSLVKLCKKKEALSAHNFAVLILLVGIAVGLATAFFAKGGPAFLLLAYLCLFALAVLPLAEEGETTQKKQKLAIAIGVTLAAVCFVLFAVVTFSIPLPSSLIGNLVK